MTASAELSPVEVVARWDVVSVYQPVVDLRTGRTVGCEALARGARGSGLESPAELFAAAAAADDVHELDWQCRLAAVRGLGDTTVPPGSLLLVNVEPTALEHPDTAWVGLLAAEARRRGWQLAVEITERQVSDDPACLLAFRRRLRAENVLLAIDDVGADPASLAMMPLLEPDIVKLDMRLVQARPSMDIARILAAVNAEATRSGCLVVAEGIETAEQSEIAASMGARLGQGWWFGRPGALPVADGIAPLTVAELARPRVDMLHTRTPWDLVRHEPSVRRGAKPLLAAMSEYIEDQALIGDATAVLVGAFQHRDYVKPRVVRRWSELAGGTHLTAMIAELLDDAPAAGLRAASIAASDPLRHEWTVALITAHHGVALVAHDVGDTGAEADRRFDFVVTYDREVALKVCRRLTAYL
ncbi:EAL domain-containing protein [Solicola sp. PLA-1-18]|uniref:sensor domain-containing phosphodiesterase n=1 Tax=Solicola sp. PLA-1-18 TaxID=3380532 RepID=UPI003B822CA2